MRLSIEVHSRAREKGRKNGSFSVAEKRALASWLKPLGFKEEQSDDARGERVAKYNRLLEIEKAEIK